MLHKFINEDDLGKVLFWTAGGFSAMFTNIDLLFKILIGAATLIYLFLKIEKALEDRKARKQNKNEIK